MSKSEPYLEIQYHPGDIRRGVRYIFLTRRQVFWWTVGFFVYLFCLGAGLLIAPSVVSIKLDERRYAQLEERRGEHGEHLRQLVEQLAELETDSAKTLNDMRKIHLAYGLINESSGQGGYPAAPPEVHSDSIYRMEVERAAVLETDITSQIDRMRVFLNEVESFETANQDQVAMTPSISPVEREAFVMTSPFGNRRSPFTKAIDFHPGLDLAAAIGTPIYAPADGTVTFAGRYPLKQSVAWWRYGNLVALRHGDRFMTLYGHCDEIRVRVGQKVKQGEEIATVGDTGWSTNPHLHYEIRWLGENGEWNPVDPRIYILDHEWHDEENVLIRARNAPSSDEYEPLPRVIGRRR